MICNRYSLVSTKRLVLIVRNQCSLTSVSNVLNQYPRQSRIPEVFIHTRRTLSSSKFSPTRRPYSPSLRLQTHRTLTTATTSIETASKSKPTSNKSLIAGDWTKSHNFLKSHPEYNKLLFHPESHPATHPLVLEFLNITAPDACIVDPKYEDKISPILSSLGDLSDNDLLQVLYHWTKFPKPEYSPKKEPFQQFWKTIDQECLRRAIERRRWMSDINFFTADLYFQLGLAFVSNFHWNFVKQLLRRVDILTKEVMVRFSFHLSLAKDLPESISLFNLEYNIPRINTAESPLSTDELAIICLSFFKEKIPLHDKALIVKILDRVRAESKTISSQNLATIVKALRLSGHKTIEVQIDQFLEAFVSEVDRLDLHACCSLVWLGTRAGVRNRKLLEAVATRVQGNLNNAHLKNLHYLCLGLCEFNIDCQPLYNDIVEVLRDIYKDMKEISSHVKTNSRILPVILSLLASQNIYPKDLISLVFSDEFLERFYGSRMFLYQPELMILDQNVMLEVKDYDGPTLLKKARGYLIKKNMMWIDPPTKERVHAHQYLCRLVHKSLLEIFEKPDLLHMCNILPHHQSIEVVFCTNTSGEVIPVPESFKSKPEFEPKFLTPEDRICGQTKEIQYHVVLIYFWEKLVFNTNEPLGKGMMLKRQIGNMGFKTHTVTQSAWRNFTTPEEQKSYILSILGDQIILPSPNLSLMDNEPADHKLQDENSRLHA